MNTQAKELVDYLDFCQSQVAAKLPYRDQREFYDRAVDATARELGEALGLDFHLAPRDGMTAIVYHLDAGPEDSLGVFVGGQFMQFANRVASRPATKQEIAMWQGLLRRIS
jgi:hypothetical protein